MSDDHSATTSTAGTVTVGGSATGVIERKGDVDWFAVELVEGRTYVIDLEGAGAGTGTLGDAMLWGLFDDAGVRVAKRSRDGGEGNDARMVFTATESGTHYIAARGQRKDDTGTYTVRVRDQDAGTQAPANTNTVRTPEQTTVQQPPQPPADPDATAAGAAGLGDLAGLGRRGAVRQDSVDGGDDGTDYYSFTLSERQAVTLSLFRQDANADLYLEDGEGTVLASSTEDGTRKDEVKATLDAGTYYVRVAAQEAGENAYTLRAKAADPVAVVPVAPESLPQQHASQQQQAPDPDATAAGATGLGDLAAAGARGARKDSVDGTADGTDYFSFTLSSPETVKFKLKGLDANADLYLEDGWGNVLASSTNDGKKAEEIKVTLPSTAPYPYADTYYVRVEAKEAGANSYTLSYSAGGLLDFEEVERIEDQLLARVPPEGWTPPPPPPPPPPPSIPEPDGLQDFAQDTSTRGVVTVGSSVEGTIGSRSGGEFLGIVHWTYVDSEGQKQKRTIESKTPVTFERPDDVDWFAVELEAGRVYRFDVQDSSRDDGLLPMGLTGLYDKDGEAVGFDRQEFGKFGFFAPTEDGTFYAAVGSAPWMADRFRTGDYTLSVAEVEDDFTADTDTTGAVAVGGSVWGEVDYWDDRDWIKVELEAGETYRIELLGSRKLNGWSHDVPAGNVDPELARQKGERATLWDYHMRGAVYDADGNRIGDDALGWGGLDARWHRPPGCKEGWLNRVEFTPTESGAYYIEVDTGHDPAWTDDPGAPSSAVGTYKVSVTESDFVATEEYTL